MWSSPDVDYRLHVFRQVAEVRSLTKASKALHLSQPALSKHIKLLEEELRVPLFVRSSTGVVLTDAGTIFLKHVQETEKSRAAVMEKLQAPVGLLTGTLRLGSSMTIASYYLPDVLVGFKAKHAAVKCEVVEGNTDLILGLLLDQRIELGLVEGPCRRREIQVRPFYQDEVIWVAAPFDPLAKVKNPSTQALLERPINFSRIGFGYASGDGARSATTRMLVIAPSHRTGITQHGSDQAHGRRRSGNRLCLAPECPAGAGLWPAG